MGGGSDGGRFASVKCLCDNDVVDDRSSAVMAAVAGSASDLDVPRPITDPCTHVMSTGALPRHPGTR
jgi:hypothetical protein